MIAVKESLPSFPQLMESLGHPEEPPQAWRNPPQVIDEDAASDTRSTTSSRSARNSPVIPPRPSTQLDSDVLRTRKSRSPSGSASKENVGRHRFAPYHARGPSVPSINIDKANKAAEKGLPTPPISQSLRRANRPQPLALAPRSNNPDIAPAPISALLRAHIEKSSPATHSGLMPHTASPRISGHIPHAPRSPMHPMTPVSIPMLPPNLPISPISAQFAKEAYHRRDIEMQRDRALTPASAHAH